MRAVAYVIVGWLGLILGSSLPAAFPSLARLPAPDAALLVVLFVGLSRRGGLAAACLLATALGYLDDLSAGSPKCMHVIACLALAVVARAASARLLVRGVLPTVLIGGLFAAGFELAVVALRDWLGVAVTAASLRQAALASLSTAIVAPPVFALLRRIDRFFARDPRALAVGP